MKTYDFQVLEEGVLLALHEGSVSIPHLLLKYYRGLQLSEVDVMLLIHLIAFWEKDHNNFPTIEEIQERMSAAPESVIQSLQKLMKQSFLSIDGQVDPVTGVQSETYNLAHLLRKLASYAVEMQQAAQPEEEEKKAGNDIFSIFEKEFGRPLSPMECEVIAKWIDKDSLSEPLILAALKEAVFAGKLHFRYIDRILLDWQRNRVTTPEEAKEYTQRFRGK